MKLLDRQIKIIDYLNGKNDWVKGIELAKLINVSDRTIRNDIIAIKNVYGDEVLKSSRSRGYKFNINESIGRVECNVKIESPKERNIYLLKSLLIKDMDIYDLVDELYVSECTLEGDINRLKNLVNQVSQGAINIFREGDLIKLRRSRKYKNNILYDVAKYENYDLSLNDMQKYFNDINLDYLSELITEILYKNSCNSRYLSITKLTIDLAISMESIYIHHINYGESRAYMTNSHWVRDDSLESNRISLEIVNMIEDKFGIKIFEEDLWLLSYIIKTAKLLEKNEDEIRNTSIKEDEFYHLCKDILMEFKGELGIDFLQDENIVVDLAIHLKIAMERMKLGVKLYNPLREQLNNEYTFLFSIAILMLEKIRDKYNIFFDVNEISYIVVYLATAMHKIRENIEEEKSPKVLLVVKEGVANLRYIENQIYALKIPCEFEVKGVTNISNMDDELKIESNYDLVIATVDKFKKINHPSSIIVQKNFTDMDKINVKNTIENADRVRKKVIVNRFCEKFLKEKLFINNLQVKTKEEVIEKLIEILKINGYINGDYSSKVLEREKFIPTSIESGVALPHVFGKEGIKNAMAIGILKNQINWGIYKVKVVILLAYDTKDRKDINIVLSDFSQLMQNELLIDNIKKCNDFKNFISILEENL